MGWDYDSSSSSSCSESSTDMAYGDSSVHSDNEEMEEAGEEEESKKISTGTTPGIFTQVKDALQHTGGIRTRHSGNFQLSRKLGSSSTSTDYKLIMSTSILTAQDYGSPTL
ncbi:hypothetical protein GQ600_12068 [Phytophthora cactorum]|nr:hypothetical protein GQ600_12068 [Phytophthora cactorum]